MSDLVRSFAEAHALSGDFVAGARAHYLPIVDALVARKGLVRCLGINGAQGTGKSTLTAFLVWILGHQHGWRVATLSIDDLYYDRETRARLAGEIHPLLATRGVPGTHDVALGTSLLTRLRNMTDEESVRLPRFDKATDEPAPRASWPLIAGPVDLVVLEGWCVATIPQDEVDLAAPVNRLEADEDRTCRWRRYVNQQLQDPYPALFEHIDELIFLRAPDLARVFEWRLQQERELRARTAAATHVMDEADLARFIQHFERLTRWNLESLPARADLILDIAHDHRVIRTTPGAGTRS